MNSDPAARQIAQDGLQNIESAILELLERKPEGLSNVEIAELLDLRSDFRGGSRNYLTYSVLGGLLRRGKVRREGEHRSAKYLPLPRSDEESRTCVPPQRLSPSYDPAASTWYAVNQILQIGQGIRQVWAGGTASCRERNCNCGFLTLRYRITPQAPLTSKRDGPVIFRLGIPRSTLQLPRRGTISLRG